MQCSNCNINSATKKCSAVINSIEKELYLCDECYERLYNHIFQTDSNFFGNIFGNAFGGYIATSEKVCKNCGTKFSEFEKTGIAGCAYCYDAFSKEIEGYILKQQGKAVHIGKSPRSNRAKKDGNNE